jgi:glycosyltransferase involved in cell wall biosynthesis
MKRVLIVGNLPEALLLFWGILLDHMVSAGHTVRVCAPPMTESVRSALKAKGVSIEEIPMDRTGINPVRDMRYFLALYRTMKVFQPDVVLNYTIKPNLYGSMAARLAYVPVSGSIVTGLGYAFTPGGGTGRLLLRRFLLLFYRFALRWNKTVFFLNADDKALMLAERGVRPEQAHQLPGAGVDISRFRVAPIPAKPAFLMIARLLVDKGVREYAAAARQVRSRHPDAEFRLVGWLDENPACIRQDELDNWTKSGDIQFLGRLDDVRSALAECSVYVLPSYREGMPQTVLEALASGRAVITTDAPGCRESIVNGVEGLIVPARDAQALADAMERMISSPELIRVMALSARKRAETIFEATRIARSVAEKLGC